jgi:RNA recognition motif-containing protein
MNIYVGNLTPDTTEDELREAFASYGEITTIKIIRDGATGESRGFGFVEMPGEEQAKAAITEMNGKELKGNQLHVEAGRAKAAPTGFGGGGRRPGGSDRPRSGGGGRPSGRFGGGRPGGGRPSGGGGGRGGDRGDRGPDRGGRPRY